MENDAYKGHAKPTSDKRMMIFLSINLLCDENCRNRCNEKSLDVFRFVTRGVQKVREGHKTEKRQ